MQQTINGVVNRVITKNGLNWLTLQGDESLYSTYKTTPACKSGDSIEFAYTQKGQYKNADAKTIRVTGAAPAEAAPAASTQSTWKPDPSRQISIELQSARRDAIDMLKVMIDAGAIKIPTKQADKFDALVGMTELLTAKLYSWVKEPDTLLQSVELPDVDSEE